MHFMNDRFSTGLSNLSRLEHEAPNRIIQAFKDFAPDFARYVMEFQFGDIYSRPGLDIKFRQTAAIAGLVALGNAVPQLKFHINAAINTGSSREEIVEIIVQMAAISGFPSAFNGLLVAKDVFFERDSRGQMDVSSIRDESTCSHC